MTTLLGAIVMASDGWISPAHASVFGSGTFGSCQFGSCSITLTTSGSVLLNITPALSKRCTIASDTTSVLTDNSNGYTLTLTSSTTQTSLSNGASTIPTQSADENSPLPLSTNRWGYRVDSTAGFGAGPTSAVQNTSGSSLSFAGIVPSDHAGAVLKATSVPANPADNTTVWYGACVDSSITSGTYSAAAMYTAVIN